MRLSAQKALQLISITKAPSIQKASDMPAVWHDIEVKTQEKERIKSFSSDSISHAGGGTAQSSKLLSHMKYRIC